MRETQTIVVQVNGVSTKLSAPNPLTPMDFAEMSADMRRISDLMGKYKEGRIKNCYHDRRKISEKQVELIKLLTEKGLSAPKVAKKLGLGLGTAYKYRKQ